MKKKRIDNNDTVTRTYCLFGDGCNVGMAVNENINRRKTSQEKTAVGREEPEGTQDIVKQPGVSEQGNKDTGDTVEKTRPGNKESGTDDNPETVSPTRKRKRRTVSEKGNRKTEIPEPSEPGNDSDYETQCGYIEPGIDEREGRQEIRTFPKSNIVLDHIKLKSKPMRLRDFSLVQVEIDDKNYEVSSWSVVDDNYIQGLDSNFIVHNLVTKKNKDKYLNDNLLKCQQLKLTE